MTSALMILRRTSRGTDSHRGVRFFVVAELNPERLRLAIGALPDPTARMLFLAVSEGLTYTEIAVRIGWPAPKVASEMRSSLRLLRHQVS